MRRRLLLPTLLALAVLPGSAAAHPGDDAPPPVARVAQDGTLAPCPGDPIDADRVITGSFGTEEQGAYVMVPFDVPAGTTAVRVKYCFDQPELAGASQQRHTLDLGLWGPGGEFRGWGGSSHPDVTVSPEGFSDEAAYREAPKGHVPGRTTRGFLPGAVRPGRWEAELGVAAVVGRDAGDADGRVAWRLELELARDPAFADEPYAPAPFDERPARQGPGWYAGDLHVHAEHSALGDATIRETADFAFAAPPDGAGLDFVTFSDYVTTSGWGELGRHQARYPGRLLARSSEVVTYRGHFNNHVSQRYVDHRFGRVLAWDGGRLSQRRAARPPSGAFAEIQAAGGFTQVNHPTIFPSEVPLFRTLCRGCPWDYSDAETGWPRVDAYEVHTGPPGFDAGPNPFTLTAIAEYDRLRRAGHRLAAVAVSDSHNAGRTPNPVTQAPVGTGTTVVYAPELSERGLRAAVLAGRTYAKVFGPGSVDLRLELRNERGSAIIGGSLPGDRAELVAQVLGGDDAPARSLQVLRDGQVVETVPVGERPFELRRAVEGRGDWRIQVLRGPAVDALTTPITLGRAPDPEPSLAPATGSGTAARPRLRVRVRPRRVTAGRRARLVVRVTSRRRAVRRALVRVAGARARTGRRGRAVLRTRFARPGIRRVRATRRGFRAGTARVRVVRRVRAPVAPVACGARATRPAC